MGKNGDNPLAWIVGVWSLVGITSWSEAASFAAFCFTMYLLFGHIYRDFVRPFFERLGWIKPRHHAAVPVSVDEEALERME